MKSLTNNILLLLLLFHISSYSQNKIIENFKKNYYVNENKNGFILLEDKDNYRKIKIANSKGEIIYSHEKEDAFFGKLECNKFFTATQLRSGNDGGGYTIVDYVNVKLYDVTNIKNPINFNYNLLMGLKREKGNIFRILDFNDNVGLINSCGEILVQPLYKRIHTFNDEGYAVALSEKEIKIIDTLGNQIVSRSFKHGMSSVSKRDCMKCGNIWEIIKNNRILASNDGKLFGIYDFKSNKELIPFNYQAVYLFDKEYDKPADEDFYILVKDNKNAVVDYKTLKEILPFSENADGIRKIVKIDKGYLVSYYKKVSSVNSNVNVFYDGKSLFDDKLDIKNIEIKYAPFIVVHLYNGESMIYDIQKSKFIIAFKNNLVNIGQIIETNPYQLSKNMQNQYKSGSKYRQVNIPCGNNCSKSMLIDLDGNAKTKPTLESSYTIIQIDKEKELFFYLVLDSNKYFNLYNNDGKLILENFKIADNEKDYAYVVKDNTLILNEVLEKGLVYNKTAFDIEGNIIGERYKFRSEPSIVKEVINTDSDKVKEAKKTNRFLKDIK